MVKTASTMLPLGTVAPEFSLPDVRTDQSVTLKQLASRQGTVVMFICNHCPYVVHINHKLVEVANTYQAQGISFIAISSNDAKAYPQDGPQQMRKQAQQLNYPFPYLYDESQEVAKAYQAACTPDFYLFDGERRLVYRGQFDDARPGNQVEVTGSDLCQAMDSLLEGTEPQLVQKPSLGCNIKWKEV